VRLQFLPRRDDDLVERRPRVSVWLAAALATMSVVRDRGGLRRAFPSDDGSTFGLAGHGPSEVESEVKGERRRHGAP